MAVAIGKFVSAHTPQGPQLTTHARPLVTVPMFRRQGRGHPSWPSIQPSHDSGAKRWGRGDSGLATSHGLTPVYPDAGTSHTSPSMEPLQSLVSPPSHSPPRPARPARLLSPSLHPLPLRFLDLESLVRF